MRKGGSFLVVRAKTSSAPPFRFFSGLLFLCGRRIRLVRLASVEARALAAEHGCDIEALKRRLEMHVGWSARERPVDEAVGHAGGRSELQPGVIGTRLAEQWRAGRRALREHNRRGHRS